MKYRIVMLTLFATLSVLLLSACTSSSTAATDTPEPPAATEPLPTATADSLRKETLLFIGDSYSGDFRGMDNQMEAMAAAAAVPWDVEADSVIENGTSMRGHWDHLSAVEAIRAGDWSMVILQDDMFYYDWDAEPFFEYQRRFHDAIEQAGAETVLFMAWQMEGTAQESVQKVEEAYATLGAELGVKVAPVGIAWQRAIAERPDLDLYAPDGNHAKIAGMYLALSVLYATIFDETPVGIPYEPADLIGSDEAPYYMKMRISAEDQAFLQRIAWETVVDYRQANE